MKYLVFNTEQEALGAEAQISHRLGCPIIGVNAKTGAPAPDRQVITGWAIPQQIQDGRWVFPSPDDNGVEPSDDWFPVQEF